MTGVLLSAANWPIVGQIAWLLGKFINLIYTSLDNLLGSFDTGLVGISVIIFTIVVYTCLLPLTIKQQRSAKMSAVMNPEIQAVQKKYKGKTDQVSMMRQQEEMRQVYDKYGTSMMGGCLPLSDAVPVCIVSGCQQRGTVCAGCKKCSGSSKPFYYDSKSGGFSA